MKGKYTFYILVLFSVFACKEEKKRADQIVLDRIEYVYNLKSLIDKNIWSGLSDAAYDVPLIYYSGKECYVSNPTAKFIEQYEPELVFENARIKIYKTPLIDSIPFHMHVTVSFDQKEDFSYKSPFMKCSSPEITKETVPDVPSTEVWATMVMHEYFHGFQLKHQKFFDYFEGEVALLTQDTLESIYSQNKWYKESIAKENDILLTAIASTDTSKIKSLVESFFCLREQRRANAKQKLNVDVTSIEELFEAMEGTARYVEYGLYDIFSEKQPDAELLKADTLYQSYAYFNNFKFEEAKWLYKTGSTYYYAIGFNMLRLLDKLNVDYKSTLFLQGNTSLEGILRATCSI